MYDIQGIPHLCVGAFSGNPVAADPGDDKDGGDDIDRVPVYFSVVVEKSVCIIM